MFWQGKEQRMDAWLQTAEDLTMQTRMLWAGRIKVNATGEWFGRGMEMAVL